MTLTREQIKKLPDGVCFKIFYAGSDWEQDFGRVDNVVKVKDTLYVIKEWHSIDDIYNVDDSTQDPFSLIAAIDGVANKN